MHSPRRLCFVNHSPSMAGGEVVMCNNALALKKLGYDVTMVFPSKGKLVQRVEAQGVRTILQTYSWNINQSFSQPVFWRHTEIEALRFKALFSELKADCVIANTTLVTSACLAGWMANIPVILHLHGLCNRELFPDVDLETFRILEYMLISLANRRVVPTNYIKNIYSNMYGWPSDALQVIPNGVSIPECSQEPVDLKTKTPEFIMLCTLEPNKNVPMLIKAARILKDKGINVKFKIYGEGSAAYCEKLNALMRKNNVMDSVEIHGRTSNTDLVYRNCTGVIVASNIESFSMVAVEAMASAKPVIATRCGGPEEIIRDGETGYLIDKNDSQALADKIAALIADPALCRTLAANGLQHCRETFAIQTVAQQWSDLILAETNTFKATSCFKKNLFMAFMKQILVHKSLANLCLATHDIAPETTLRPDLSQILVRDAQGTTTSDAFALATSLPKALLQLSSCIYQGTSYMNAQNQEKSFSENLIDGEPLFYDVFVRKGNLKGLILSFSILGSQLGTIHIELRNKDFLVKGKSQLQLRLTISETPTYFDFFEPIRIDADGDYELKLFCSGSPKNVPCEVRVLEQDIDTTKACFIHFVYQAENEGDIEQ